MVNMMCFFLLMVKCGKNYMYEGNTNKKRTKTKSHTHHIGRASITSLANASTGQGYSKFNPKVKSVKGAVWKLIMKRT